MQRARCSSSEPMLRFSWPFPLAACPGDHQEASRVGEERARSGGASPSLRSKSRRVLAANFLLFASPFLRPLFSKLAVIGPILDTFFGVRPKELLPWSVVATASSQGLCGRGAGAGHNAKLDHHEVVCLRKDLEHPQAELDAWAKRGGEGRVRQVTARARASRLDEGSGGGGGGWYIPVV